MYMYLLLKFSILILFKAKHLLQFFIVNKMNATGFQLASFIMVYMQYLSSHAAFKHHFDKIDLHF